MPYIGVNREELDGIAKMVSPNITEGELNYLFTKIMVRHVSLNGESYSLYNKLIGMLECCKLEMYRMFVAPYEDVKMEMNGAVDGD